MAATVFDVLAARLRVDVSGWRSGFQAAGKTAVDFSSTVARAGVAGTVALGKMAGSIAKTATQAAAASARMAASTTAAAARMATAVAAAGARAGRGLAMGIGNGAKMAGAAIGGIAKAAAGLGLALGGVAAFGFKGFKEGQIALRKVQAVIDATGGSAGKTADELSKMAGDLQKVTNFGDDTILTAQSMLLTFKNIKGNTFDRVTEAAMDMAAVTGDELAPTMEMLGKAINNPIRGMQLLRRQGIEFTKEQQAQIKEAVAAGNMQKAQGIILDELAKKYGGAARKMAEPWTIAKNMLGEAAEVIGSILAPRIDGLGTTVGNAAIKLTEFLEANRPLIEGVVNQAWDALAAGVVRVADAFVAMGAKAVPPLQAVAAAVGDLWTRGKELFDAMPKWAQDALLIGGALTGIGAGLSSIGGLVPVLGPLAAALGGILNPIGLLKTALMVLGPIIGAISGPVAGLIAVVGALGGSVYYAATQTEQGAQTWGKLRDIFLDVADRVAGAVLPLFDGLIGKTSGFGDAALKVADIVGNWLLTQVLALANALPGLVDTGIDYATAAFDALKPTLDAVWDAMTRVGAAVVDLGEKAFAKLQTWLDANREGLNDLWDAAVQVGQFLGGVFLQAIRDIADLLAWLAENAVPVVLAVFDQWLAQLSMVIDVVRGVVDAFGGDFRRIVAIANEVAAAVLGVVADMVDNIKEMLGETISEKLGIGSEGIRETQRQLEQEAQIYRDALDKESADRQKARDEEAAADAAAAEQRKAQREAERAERAAEREKEKADAAGEASLPTREDIAAAAQEAVGGGEGAAPAPAAPAAPGAGPAAPAAGPAKAGGAIGLVFDIDKGASFKELKAQVAVQAQATQAAIREAAQSGATQEQLAQLQFLQQNAIAAMNAIVGTKGEARDKAIEFAQQEARAFEAAFANIESGSKKVWAGMAADAEQAANKVVGAADKMAKGVNDAQQQAQQDAGGGDGGGGGLLGDAVGGAMNALQGLSGQVLARTVDLSGMSPEQQKATQLNNARAQLFQLQHNRQFMVGGYGSGFGGASIGSQGIAITRVDEQIQALRMMITRLSRELGQPSRLASGGIVTGPTQALLGEAGPEAVIPLHGAGAAMLSGGGVTINATFAKKYTPAEADSLIAAIESRLKRTGSDVTGRRPLRAQRNRSAMASRIR